jgi:hypothetical protein
MAATMLAGLYELSHHVEIHIENQTAPKAMLQYQSLGAPTRERRRFPFNALTDMGFPLLRLCLHHEVGKQITPAAW